MEAILKGFFAPLMLRTVLGLPTSLSVTAELEGLKHIHSTEGQAGDHLGILDVHKFIGLNVMYPSFLPELAAIVTRLFPCLSLKGHCD